MKTLKTVLIPTLLGLAALSTVANAGEEKKLTEQQVPKPVLEAFHKAYPQALDVRYETEKEAGKTVYEVEFKDKGINREASYSAQGALLEAEEGINPDALPAAVAEALKKAHPSATVEEAEKLAKADGTANGYEVEIKDGKKTLEIHLDANGKILKTEAERQGGEGE
jgi:uncharacterized membrane protein YkoI